MKNQKRSIRRHHRERLGEKRKYYWSDSLEESGRIHYVINTPKPCSCFMCGNPRKYWKEVTRQEKSSEMKFKDRLSDLGYL